MPSPGASIAIVAGVDDKLRANPHAPLIGTGKGVTPATSGYFYANWNDAYNCYEHNRGKVTLTVTPVTN